MVIPASVLKGVNQNQSIDSLYIKSKRLTCTTRPCLARTSQHHLESWPQPARRGLQHSASALNKLNKHPNLWKRKESQEINWKTPGRNIKIYIQKNINSKLAFHVEMNHFYPQVYQLHLDASTSRLGSRTCMMVALRPACLISSASAWPFCRSSSCRSLKKFLRRDGGEWKLKPGRDWRLFGEKIVTTKQVWLEICGGFLKWWYPQIIHFNRGFHYFHHPFWGTTIFGNTHVFSDKLRHSLGESALVFYKQKCI